MKHFRQVEKHNLFEFFRSHDSWVCGGWCSSLSGVSVAGRHDPLLHAGPLGPLTLQLNVQGVVQLPQLFQPDTRGTTLLNENQFFYSPLRQSVFSFGCTVLTVRAAAPAHCGEAPNWDINKNGPQGLVSLPIPWEFLHNYAMILQRIRIIQWPRTNRMSTNGFISEKAWQKVIPVTVKSCLFFNHLWSDTRLSKDILVL